MSRLFERPLALGTTPRALIVGPGTVASCLAAYTLEIGIQPAHRAGPPFESQSAARSADVVSGPLRFQAAHRARRQ